MVVGGVEVMLCCDVGVVVVEGEIVVVIGWVIVGFMVGNV